VAFYRKSEKYHENHQSRPRVFESKFEAGVIRMKTRVPQARRDVRWLHVRNSVCGLCTQSHDWSS